MVQRRHKKSSYRRKRHSKNNMIGNSVKKVFSVSKKTSQKYMPKVKSGLENVGSKVTTSAKKTVPYLQGVTRKFFGMFGINKKTKKNRH